jgi:hypothetical protein
VDAILGGWSSKPVGAGEFLVEARAVSPETIEIGLGASQVVQADRLPAYREVWTRNSQPIDWCGQHYR